MSDVEYDIAIIGSGLSGLVAAYSLLEKDSTLKILIIEKENVSGGQIVSSPEGELGARWFNADHKELINLCEELDVCVQKYQSVPKHLFHISDLDDDFFCALSTFELKRFFKKIDLLSTEYDCNAASSTTTDMEQYICKNLFFESSRNIIRFIIRSVAGSQAKHVKFSDFLCICQGTSGISNQFEWLTKYSEQMKVVPNYTELVKAIEKRIGNERFLFNTRILEIVENDQSVVLLTEKGRKIHAFITIVAIPWLDIKRIQIYPDIFCNVNIYSPYLSEKNYVTSFIAQYDRPYWQINGFSGFILSHNPHFICYESKRHTLSGLVFHNDGNSIHSEDILQKLCLSFGHAAGMPTKWEQKIWRQSPIQGNLLAKGKCLVWASTGASLYCRGFLNGAVIAGQRAAIFALLTIRPQLIQWKDINMVQPAAVVRPRVSFIDKVLASINFYDVLSFLTVIPISVGVYIFLLKRR